MCRILCTLIPSACDIEVQCCNSPQHLSLTQCNIVIHHVHLFEPTIFGGYIHVIKTISTFLRYVLEVECVIWFSLAFDLVSEICLYYTFVYVHFNNFFILYLVFHLVSKICLYYYIFFMLCLTFFSFSIPLFLFSMKFEFSIVITPSLVQYILFTFTSSGTEYIDLNPLPSLET